MNLRPLFNIFCWLHPIIFHFFDFCSGSFYVIFVLILGSMVERWALKSDYMVSEKVSHCSYTENILYVYG